MHRRLFLFFFNCCLATYLYLAWVLVFLNLVISCNRHFWRSMLLHGNVKLDMPLKLICYVCNRCFLPSVSINRTYPPPAWPPSIGSISIKEHDRLKFAYISKRLEIHQKNTLMRAEYIFISLLIGNSVKHGLSCLKNDIPLVFSPIACIISCIIVPTQLQPFAIEMVCFPGSAYLFPTLDEHLNMKLESRMMIKKWTCDYFKNWLIYWLIC